MAATFGAPSCTAKRSTLSIIIPQDDPTQTDVQAELAKVEKAEMGRYIARFDLGDASVTVEEFLQSKYPGSKITFREAEEGVTGTRIVKVDGVATHMLKRVRLPQNIFGDHWRDLLSHLRYTRKTELLDQVRTVFLENPGQILTQDYPHFNYAHREKLAFVVGSDLGVPKTETLLAIEGMYSLHTYVPSAGSARTFDIAKEEHQKRIHVQSLQNMGILDMVLESQDRGPGNILVVPQEPNELFLVPVDHSLTLQHEEFKKLLRMGGIKPPCWLHWEKANLPLTEESKQRIARLDPEEIIAKAKEQGLIADSKVETSIRENIRCLQKIVSSHPECSLKDLFKAYVAQGKEI